MLRLGTGAARLLPALVTITAALTTAAPAAAQPHRIYGGALSSTDPFALELSHDGASLGRVLFRARARCADGSPDYEAGAFPFQTTKGKGDRNRFFPNRLGRGGRFRSRGTATEYYDDGTYGDLTETLAGRVNGATARGTLQMSVELRELNTGRLLTTCRTPVLSWKAESVPGKVFSGLTARGEPIVIQMTSDRLRVDDFNVVWLADCQPSGFLDLNDRFGGMFVDTSGRFGDSEDDPYDFSDGSHASYHYDIHGRIGRTTASGTFAATATFTTADGSPDGTCTLPSERWKASS